MVLKRTKDLGKTFTTIHEDIYSFGYIGAFLFFSVMEDPVNSGASTRSTTSLFKYLTQRRVLLPAEISSCHVLLVGPGGHLQSGAAALRLHGAGEKLVCVVLSFFSPS